ncbi:MAG: hypothetical protein FJW34_00770 [Acidobacteria bacterium]|nr:hypothetical protein [Acidobacteriota bacterium]
MPVSAYLPALVLLVWPAGAVSPSFSPLFQGGPGEGTPWPKSSLGITTIPVCFRAPGTTGATQQGNPYTVNYTQPEWLAKREFVKNALLNSWQKWTRIVFAGWGSCSGSLNGWLYIDLIKHDCGGCGDSIPRGYHSTGVRVWLMMENPDDRLLRTIVIHEIGHALGFHHEMDRPDAKRSDGSFICTDGPVEYPQGTYLTGYYDDVSVMNYCAPRNRNGLSFGDIEGAQRLYGTSSAGRWMKAQPALSLVGM